MNQPLLIEEYRGGILENVHPVLVSIVDDQKNTIISYGNEQHPVFYRSAMKPIQAIPAFSSGIIEKYELTSEEATIFTASHRGESYHQRVLESIMKKLNLQAEALVCRPTYPLNDEPKFECLRNHVSRKKYFHNCSGKHFGFMAVCRERNWKMEGYHLPEHPLQQEIKTILSQLSEVPENLISAGTDGCGVPVYALPLKNIAISYLKFACPDLIEDSNIRNAVKQIGEVMNENPEIVASHQFICTELLHDKNIVAKGGAQGMYCLSLRKEHLSIALKVLSGSELVWPVVVANLLEKIGYSNYNTIERLKGLRTESILNDNGLIVGQTLVTEERCEA
jgi:L-asparaginase II